MYAILGAYTLIGTSVAGMAITMVLRHDPDASTAVVIGMTSLAVMLAAVTWYVYRPLFRRVSAHPDPSTPGSAARVQLEESAV